MSSGDEAAPALSSDVETSTHPSPAPRLLSRTPDTPTPTPSTPGTPRKRRRIESAEPLRVRKHYLEGKYNDAYRVLFNDQVRHAACPPPADGRQLTAQYGASTWSGPEQAALFAALARLGRDDVAALARAVATKTIAETRALLLLLDEAAARSGDLGLTLRDIPAAVELGPQCTEELDVMAEVLAWFQEQWELAEEQKRHGDYWLITPSVAATVELAINGPSRPASSRPITPAEPATPRSGSGIAGSCVRCRRHKIRCDRNLPCANCARLKTHVTCEYPPSKQRLPPIDPPAATPNLDDAKAPLSQPDSPVEPQILQAIPQASLLHAENMLVLSRNVFMNRSPAIPSPWPHWSAYASEQVPEPSIVRTAFNDFHTLAVSVTKRLMQTAIMQATSRLRSQRRRTKKGVMPLVKRRDVLSAIDVLGLKRNGRTRWTGVARRCNLQVFDEQRTTRFKTSQREMSWNQVEDILGLYDTVSTSSTGADVAGPTLDVADGVFRHRAARHGTPLPMQHLSPSNSDSHLEMEGDSASSSDMEEELANYVKEDSTDRASSVESEQLTPDRAHEKQTLEQFDQQASRHAEESLCELLGITTAVRRKLPDAGELEDDDEHENETLYTGVDDWRKWTNYHAAWEEYQTPVPNAKFAAIQKPRAAPAVFRASVDSDASSTSQGPQQPRVRGTVELQPQNPRDYAAMQGFAYDMVSDSSVSGDEADADVPAQSIESTGIAYSSDAMDWET